MKDLIALVADTNMRFALKGILSRPKSLRIRPLSYDIPNDYLNNDPGLLNEGYKFLRLKQNLYHHALLIFDREGCGKETLSRIELERIAEEQIQNTGWEDRAAAIVIDPELENWVWSDSPHVGIALGWNKTTPIQDWLSSRGFTFTKERMPNNPKEAVQAVLLETHKHRSSNIYQQIASTASLDRCSDPAFLKLKSTLQSWFADETAIERTP